MPPYALPKSEIQRLVEAEAVRQGLNPALVVALARQESSLDPTRIGDNGRSVGLFQLQPAAAIDAGGRPEDRYDVPSNIRLGVRYFKQQWDKEGGNVERALSRYNRGTPTYRGIGDPNYEMNVLRRVGAPPTAPPRRSLASRVVSAVSPRSAEAATGAPSSAGQAEPDYARLRGIVSGPPPAAPPTEPDYEQLRAIVRGGTPSAAPSALPGLSPGQAPAAPSAPPSEAAVPAAPAASGAPDWRQYAPVSPVEAAAEANKSKPWWQPGAAMGVSTVGAMLGTAAGALAAPLTGPLAPAMPLVGEMAGSYLGRQLNVALGLEDPGGLGDVASVVMPGITGGTRTAQALRNAPAAPIVPSRAAERVARASDAQVPLTYGEAIDSPLAQRAETLLEQVPAIGTAGFRRRQQAAVKAAAQTELDAQRQVMQQTPWHGLPQVQAAAAQGNKQAQRVLDDIAQSGDDWSKIVQASGNLKAFRARQVAGTLYGKVSELAEGLGNVPLTKTLATIDDTLKALRTAVVPDPETIRYLEQLRSGLQGQTSTTVSPLLDAAGNAITKTVTTPGKTTYGQLRQLRSDLGDTISDYYRGSNAVVGAKGVGSLAKVRTALDQDLDTFALQSPHPEVAAAAQRADQYYKRQVVPYEDTQLARALTSDTPDEIYGKFIQRGHRDRAQKFYHALDPRGKAAVQYGMIAEAQQKALDPTTGVFSPKKFASALETIQDARGVFFTGQDQWKLDGFLKVMRAAERAGQFAENPPTGNRVIPLLLGGGALSYVTTPGTAVGAAATAKGLSWLLTSRAGTALLLRAHGVAEQSAAMDNVLRQLTTQGARIMATETGERLQEGQQVQVTPGRVGR